MKKTFVFLLCCLLLTFVSTNLFAASISSFDKLNVGDSLKLLPHPNSQIILDSVKVIKEKDGLDVVVSHTLGPNDASIYYHYDIDLEKLTYKTTLLPIPEEYKTISNSQSQKVGILTTTNYSATLVQDTMDAFGEVLCQTIHNLHWSVTNGTYTALVSRNITGWAACPSSFNTHWYVNYDDLYSLTYTPDHKVVKSEAEAYYHNYDFGDPSMATYARHWSLLNGDNNGYTTYTHNIVHSGESWGLLSGNVYYE